MIKFIKDLTELEREILKLKVNLEIKEVLKIDLPFIDSQSKFTILNIPSYDKEHSNNLIFVKGDKKIVHSSFNLDIREKKFEKIINQKNGESTVLIFLLLKSILKNYSQQFLRIRDVMNILDLNPKLDSIEDAGRELRRLTDRIEGLLQIILELKEDNISCFDTSLINFEYDLFSTEARYWLERSRSHNYRIASLRTKSEMQSNRELNDTMKKLTVITTFLAIAGIVVNVPGTVGAIFGIPALSDAYFKSHTTLLVITLIFTTFLSLILGLIYWRSLNLTSR